jgi:hypothetical protein
MEYNCKVCGKGCLETAKCSNGVKEIPLYNGDIIKIYPQENINGFNAVLNADGTRYNILVIPFKGDLSCGYIDTRNAFLVIDGLNKTAYAFGSGYIHPSYVHEKLIKSDSKTDARNLTQLIAETINHILSLEKKEPKWYSEKRELVK